MHKFKKSKFLIIIPSYNELKNIKNFIKKINKIAPVYILDDCSSDKTHEWLSKNNINYIKNRQNLGYEKNLLNGIKKFKNSCDYLITFDGDGQHRIKDLEKVVRLKMNYDIIVCNRKNKNRFLENIISGISKVLFNLEDPLSGFKVYKTKILKKVSFKNFGNFFLVDFLLYFKKKKLKIINLEISTNKRIGKTKVGGIISVNLKEFKIIFKLFLIKLSFMSTR